MVAQSVHWTTVLLYTVYSWTSLMEFRRHYQTLQWIPILARNFHDHPKSLLKNEEKCERCAIVKNQIKLNLINQIIELKMNEAID